MSTADPSSSLIPAYARLPVSFDRGEGVRLWDREGNEYMDALGGIAVCGLGHSHPAVTAAITEQAKTLLHTSNLFSITHQENLAQKLCKLSGMDAVFFGNSGAEANEAAIKLTRLHARRKNIENPVVITFKGSFHGRTMATLAATGNTKVHNGFSPLVSEFLHLPYNDITAIEQVIDNKNIVAIMVEPILGEGGIIVPDKGYLTAIRKICTRQNWLMICDEIQTGVARTGDWYACLAEDITPDVITSAKALGNGIPIGACLTSGDAATLIQPGHHGSTFGGNPFSCRVALAVLETMEKEDTRRNAKATGDTLKNILIESLHNRPEFKEIRGRGMMIGIALDTDCAGLVNVGLENRVIFNVTANNTVRLLPPCNLSETETIEMGRRIANSITQHCESKSTVTEA